MPMIILFRGKAGVGKSLLSTALARKTHISVLRKDDLYDSVSPFIEDIAARNAFCYEAISQIIDTNLEANSDLIVDCPYHQLQQLETLKRRVEEKGGHFVSILCVCGNEQLWAERFNIRKHQPSPNQRITDFEEMKQYYEARGIASIPLEGELVLDSVHEVDDLIRQVERYIQTR